MALRQDGRTRARARRRLWLPCAALVVAACSGPVATSFAPTPGTTSSVALPTPTATAPAGASAAPTSGPTAAPSAAAGIAGTWQGTWTSKKYPGLTGHFTLKFAQTGSDLTGTIAIAGSSCISDATITGALSGTEITFGLVKGTETITYTGTSSGASLSGGWIAAGSGTCPSDSGDWSATK